MNRATRSRLTAAAAVAAAYLILAAAYAAAAQPPAAWPRPSAALFAAVAEVESGNNPQARNEREDAVGLVQIRRVVVEDVNRILGERRYTLADRYDPARSRAMFDVYLAHYGHAYHARTGRAPTAETFARMWNGGGPDGWDKPATVAYWHKVERAMGEGR